MVGRVGHLSFDVLRAANKKRVGVFRNAHGDAYHAADGSDWTPAQWFQALAGEVGEYANLRKKFERGDISEDEFNEAAWRELADIQVYLDLLAFRLGIDLGSATIAKFNEVSRRVGANVFIVEDSCSDRDATDCPVA